MTQTTNDQFSKKLETMKREIQETKNYIVSMGSRNDQCEDRVSELEDEDAFKDHLVIETLKTITEYDKWI